MDTFFNQSPFSVIADEGSSCCWAGRADVLTFLDRIRRGWSNRSDSTLDLMWANLGAGKTHTLLHLRQLLSTGGAVEEATIVAYVEVPEHLGHFIELYRQIVPALPIKELATSALASQSGGLSNRLERAFRAINAGNQREAALARDWIIGARPGLRDLKAITGIDARIETDLDAESVLSEIIQVAHLANRRIIVLLDEFQRVGHLPIKSREALLSHVRSLFSHNPAHFSTVLAVGSRIERTAIDLLPGELRTIIGMRPLIMLPEMNAAEAKSFLVQRFACFRPEGYSGDEAAPFTGEILQVVIDYLCNEAKVHLIPRTLLQVCGMIYDEIVAAPNKQLGATEVKALMSALNWNSFDSP